MAKTGDITGLQDICTNPEMTSPVVLLLSDMMLDEFDARFNKGKESLVHKKVKKKIQKNAKAVRSILALKGK